jgi:hypothetical protein
MNRRLTNFRRKNDYSRIGTISTNIPATRASEFDLGLAYKRLGRWQESVDANQRALGIASEPEDPAWWNLGIAATALRD